MSSTILMLGNSQISDGLWMLEPSLVINCAVQGLTIREAVPFVDDLPDVTPDVIVLGFGAVEAVRQQDAIMTKEFEAHTKKFIRALRRRWPDAKILMSTVPPIRAESLSFSHKKAALAITPLNEVLRDVALEDQAIMLLEMGDILTTDTGGLAASMTYDGVHLTQEAYRLWSVHIRDLAKE